MFSLRSEALSWVYSTDMGAAILAYDLTVLVVAAAVRCTSLSMRIKVQMENG